MNSKELIAQRKAKKIYRDGDRCVKTFEDSFSKSDILNEALNLARVEEAGLNVPEVLDVCTEDGKRSITYKYIEGETMDSLMKKNPEKLDEYLEKFVDIQIDVQSRKCPMLSLLREKMINKIRISDLDSIQKYDLHTRLDGMPRHTRLCHGDFNPSNVVFGSDGKVYILDWSHATQGNGSADAARTYLLFYLEDKKEVAEKYLDLFCKKTRTPKPYVQSWIPIVAASQSVKGNKDEREFLLKWATVVDYV
ncbi:MAG: aminoglycoside phosphotransferase family protein [Sphaerochaetaceae bacterium]|nr:aminoglycoside phosphotransferase family protein [Sphaerochaetaceae bacterium]